MSTDDDIATKMQRERETRIRSISVRRPDGRGAAYSGGVEVEIDLSPNTSTTIDTNPAELRAWAEVLLAFADEIDPRRTSRRYECCDHCAGSGAAHEHFMPCPTHQPA